MKGIRGELGEMIINLNYNSKHIKRMPYQLNLRVKERVKEEINKMFVINLIFPVEELDYINPIVIRYKKVGGGIRVCVNF
jgi:hypothetical protein